MKSLQINLILPIEATVYSELVILVSLDTSVWSLPKCPLNTCPRYGVLITTSFLSFSGPLELPRITFPRKQQAISD